MARSLQSISEVITREDQAATSINDGAHDPYHHPMIPSSTGPLQSSSIRITEVVPPSSGINPVPNDDGREEMDGCGPLHQSMDVSDHFLSPNKLVLYLITSFIIIIVCVLL
jgi:hypothetical protein